MQRVEEEVRLELQLQRGELGFRQLRLEPRGLQLLVAQPAVRAEDLGDQHQRPVSQEAGRQIEEEEVLIEVLDDMGGARRSVDRDQEEQPEEEEVQRPM